MRVHHEYDFLLSERPRDDRHDEFGLGHAVGPADAARARSALKEDSRPAIRAAALRLLSAVERAKAIPDYATALDDPSDEVAVEAAHLLAEDGSSYVDRAESEAAVAAVRAHAARLRGIVSAPGDASGPWSIRQRAAEALVFASDRESLAVLLNDKELIGLGMEFAAKVALGPDDVKLLVAVATKDPKATGAIRLLVEKVPDVGTPLLIAAIDRSDVDAGFPNLIVDRQLTAAVPAVIKYLARAPRDIGIGRWLDALVKLRATCAAKAILALAKDPAVGFDAIVALRALAGHDDWKDAEVESWARAQPDDVTPCKR
jgi:hypothetical protein